MHKQSVKCVQSDTCAVFGIHAKHSGYRGSRGFGFLVQAQEYRHVILNLEAFLRSILGSSSPVSLLVGLIGFALISGGSSSFTCRV